jgi:two-component system sensor histidine kinase ArlS
MSSEMKNKNPYSPINRIGDKIKFSIVWKLNFKLFFRLLKTFLILDLMICLVFVSGLIIRAEQTAAAIAQKLNDKGLSAVNENWLDLTEYHIALETDEGRGFQIPSYFQHHLPQLTASGIRSIKLTSLQSNSPWELFKHITYNLTIKINGLDYRITYHPQATLHIFMFFAAIILLIELLMLFGSVQPGARIIRKTLQPIQELAEKAQNFSADGAFSPQQLQALAGKLENINAAKLDTRISVGETQRELQSLAEAINGMLDRINESYRSQVRFVSDASHELRTPISVIQGYANLLDRWGKNDEKTLQECIDAIKDETANMKALVEQLLFLARSDNNTITLQIEPFDLADLAKEVLRETEMIDGGHKYAAQINTAFVTADKGLIKQAARILIDNAIKYTPAGGNITISVAEAGDHARLIVQDEGIGIAPEDVSKIFDRFYRSDESRARATGGAGLGLSIAKWITERHGGYMEVLSRVDIGTKISIILPATAKN